MNILDSLKKMPIVFFQVLKKHKKTAIISASALLVLIIVLVLILTSKGSVPARIKKQMDSGVKSLMEGKYEEAVPAFEKVVQLEPENIDSRLVLAETYITLDRTDDAINILEDVINLSPERAEPYISIAQIHINRGDYESALEILNEGKDKSGDEKILAMLDELIPDAPKASLESGKYTGPITIEFEGLTEHDAVFYTLDGSEPNKESLKYEGPVSIADGVHTLRAVAYRYGVIAGDESKYEYKIELPSYVVQFTDEAFEKAVRMIVNKPEGEIRNTDLLSISNICIIGEEVIIIDDEGNKTYNEQPVTGINYSELGFYINRSHFTARGGIGNLDDVNLLPNLEYLEIIFQEKLDMSSFINLANLKTLILERNRISDINALSNLANLNRLQLKGNQIGDISVLSNLDNLTGLVLSSNQISDITALSELDKLEHLDLGGNQIGDVSVLANLINLRSLYLWDNQISDINAIAKLSNLKNLDLSFNQITDISALSNLNNLEELDLSFNQISDISVLHGLTNLKKLSLYNNPIPEKQMEKLKKALPDCEIKY